MESDKIFAGPIPEVYEKYLVPLIFASYAADLAGRLRTGRVSCILEIAAGTGVLTRALDAELSEEIEIVATDINAAMLAHAAVIGTKRPVQRREADAMRLPFPDASFDAVVCQFGVMFFPDKAAAYAEALRALMPGGTFLFSTWDRIEENEFADVVTTALEAIFPADPPRFLARTPHGYHDVQAVRRDLAAGGFPGGVRIETVTARSRASSPRIPAIAYCQGTPLRNEIESRDASKLAEATDAAADAIARCFGNGAVDGKIQGHVVAVLR